MTNERKPKPYGRYKQIFYSDKNPKYTDGYYSESDYLVTAVWERKRWQRLEIDNFQCYRCKSGQNLCVHHINYPEVWGEEDVENDLVTLCSTCHGKVHETDLEKRR